MLVGSDVFAVHHQRGVAVGFFDVAEELIVSAVLLDDVDDVANGIAGFREGDFVGAALHAIAAEDFGGQGFVVALGLLEIDARERAANQDGDVGMLLLVAAERNGFGA